MSRQLSIVLLNSSIVWRQTMIIRMNRSVLEDQEITCKNCGAGVLDAYCHHCGQSTSTGRITFRETFQNLLSATFSLEGPLLYTTKTLITNPGKVFREFLEGKRQSYYKPVSFFVVFTAVYIIIRLMLDYDPLEGNLSNEDLQNSRAAEIQTVVSEAARFMVAHINYIMFFAAFSIGLILKMLFSRRYNLAEYTAIGFFITGIYVLCGIIIMLVSKYFDLHLNRFQLLVLFSLIVYSSWSLFKENSVGSITRYFFAGLLSTLLYVILGFGFSILVILFG